MKRIDDTTLQRNEIILQINGSAIQIQWQTPITVSHHHTVLTHRPFSFFSVSSFWALPLFPLSWAPSSVPSSPSSPVLVPHLRPSSSSASSSSFRLRPPHPLPWWVRVPSFLSSSFCLHSVPLPVATESAPPPRPISTVRPITFVSFLRVAFCGPMPLPSAPYTVPIIGRSASFQPIPCRSAQ